jgi:hypothetical protein
MNRFPNACVKLIPVGPIISELLDQAPYNTLAIDSLYEDDAPHGRPSIYLIAGLITYMAIYQEIAPSAYQPPIEFIDSTIIAEYPNLVNIIWSQLLAFNDPNGSSRVFCNLSAGINQNPNEVSLNVYPNPARSYVHINSSISEGTVILRDAMGRILVEQNLNPTIRVDQIPSGYYFVEIYDTQLQKRAMKRIVIQ